MAYLIYDRPIANENNIVYCVSKDDLNHNNSEISSPLEKKKNDEYVSYELGCTCK